MNNPCPLCDTNAVYRQGHTYRHYTCPTCTDFYIDAVAEDGLKLLVEVFRTEFRKEISDLARTRASGLQCIIRESDSETRVHPHYESDTPRIKAYLEEISIGALR